MKKKDPLENRIKRMAALSLMMEEILRLPKSDQRDNLMQLWNEIVVNNA